MEYVQREWPGERAQQDMSCRALRLMADAIDAVSVAKDPRQSANEMARLRERIQEYCSGRPDDGAQADKLRRTFIAGAAAINQLATSRPPRALAAHLNAVERAAQSLDDHGLLRRQPDVIERFFHHAAEALMLLNH